MAGKLSTEAWADAVTAYQALNGQSPDAAVQLRSLADAWVAQQRAAQDAADAVDLGVKRMVAASERTDAIGDNLAAVKGDYGTSARRRRTTPRRSRRSSARPSAARPTTRRRRSPT
jgi:hypothetical protein